jgi:hypothetical protein
MQFLGLTHDVPFNSATGAPAGWGMDWMRQVLPFQRTAKLCGEGDAVPTATQTRLVGHDTPFRNSAVVAGGLGVGWIFQPPPTHRSANVEVGAWGVPVCPTAVQTLGVTHDTPPKELLAAKIPVLGGLGVAWSCQLVPFQRSANGEVEIGPGSPETVK